jgi:hypothetical protein
VTSVKIDNYEDQQARKSQEARLANLRFRDWRQTPGMLYKMNLIKSVECLSKFKVPMSSGFPLNFRCATKCKK